MSDERTARTWIPRDEYRKLKADEAHRKAKEAAQIHSANVKQRETREKWAAARMKVVIGTLALTYRVPFVFRVTIPPANCQNTSIISGCCRAKFAEQAADEGKVLQPMITMRDGIVETATLGLFLDAVNAGKWANESYAGRFGATYPPGCADPDKPRPKRSTVCPT